VIRLFNFHLFLIYRRHQNLKYVEPNDKVLECRKDVRGNCFGQMFGSISEFA